MILREFCKNRGQARLFLRCSHSKQQLSSKYGYLMRDDGSETRDKENPGALYLSKIDLPNELKDSLKLYYKRYPKKQIVEDGLKLMSHISNRGRPTHATWEKYKKQTDALERRTGKKGRDKASVSKFVLDEALQMGLLSEEQLNEEIQKGIKKTEEDVMQSIKEEENESSPQDDLENDLDVANDVEKPPKKKKLIKRPEMKAYSMIRYGSRETAAFTASLLPSMYGSTLKVLQEIRKREPNYQPETLLDFGSGTGMTVWAANKIWGDNIREYQCVDASEHMNKTAEFLLRGSSDINVPTKIPYVYFKQFLPLSNQIKYDVVVAAYTLTEMPFQKQRLQAIQSLWRKTKDFLVIIEPGNNEGFEIALQARRFITGKDEEESNFDYSQYEDMFSDSTLEVDEEDHGHIFAPCTHEHVCARTDVNTRDHPCNFSQKVELSYAFQTIRSLKRNGYFNQRFSYIVLRKSNDESDVKDDVEWARILDSVKLKRRHVICELCCHNGNIEKHVITKRKDPDVYKAARHFLKWGDMMPLDKAKRPMDIRPSPSCKNKT